MTIWIVQIYDDMDSSNTDDEIDVKKRIIYEIYKYEFMGFEINHVSLFDDIEKLKYQLKVLDHNKSKCLDSII